MEVVKKLSGLILTPECVDVYFDDFNFLDGKCFASSLSKLLGTAIVVGSLLVKLPQILKICNNRSGEGISLVSVMLDLTAITINSSYSFIKAFPFSAWGDNAFLAIQTFAIGVLVLHFAGRRTESLLFVCAYLTVCYVLMGGPTSVDVLWSLQSFNIPILLCGKSAQAYANYKNGNTGQLSAVTVLMLFGGSLARIFTSIQETGDSMMILTYAVSTTMNAIIVFQLIYYWNVDIVKKKKA